MGSERKVLMLTWYLHIGGLERMLLNLSTTLKAGGEWEPRVFVLDRRPDASPENDLSPSFASAEIPTTSFLKAPGFSLRAVLEIRRRMSAENISVLHTHDLGALIYGACVKLLSLGRVRLIHTQHSFVHLTGRWVYRYYQRFFVRFADEIVVVSDDTRRSYVDLGIRERKIHVVPNGVRFPERSVVDAAGRRELKAALVRGLDAPARTALEPLLDSRWLLYMARLDSTKGQDRALALWERLSPLARSKSALLFVGPESEAGTLKKLRDAMKNVPDPSRVLFLGATHSPDLWLGCSDVALSCSQFEGMPLGPIEAAGAGLPLVLSEIPGHAALKDCGAQYLLGDPDQGARLLERTLAELESAADGRFREAWEKARDIRSRYTLSRMSDAYARLYHA